MRLISAAKAGIINAGEWKGTFGQRNEADGTIKLVPLDPPAAGFVEFVLAGDDTRPNLIVCLQQETFALARQ